jgi:hypothetical protein
MTRLTRSKACAYPDPSMPDSGCIDSVFRSGDHSLPGKAPRHVRLLFNTFGVAHYRLRELETKGLHHGHVDND